MSKRNSVFMVALLAVGVILAGCGGGGGSAKIEDNNPPPVVTTSRTITGTVVSSSNGQGVANVVIRLVSLNLSGKTAANGQFSIAIPANTGLPVHLKVDTSLVAGAFPPGNTVRYNNQQYDPTAVDIPIAVLNEESNVLGTITIFDDSGDNAPPPPYASKNTVLTGRVVSGTTGLGVAGVSIKVGAIPSPVFPTTTGKAGYFAIDLGLDKSVLSIYPSASVSFTATLGAAASQFPSSAVIQYAASIFLPGAAMAVTAEVVAGETNDMGKLIILNSGTPTGGGGGDGGENPPPPPM